MPVQLLDWEALEEFFTALKRRGFTLIGPQLQDGAIVYDQLEKPEDLPLGWQDVQDKGSYRLHQRDDEAAFGYVVGPHSWKRFLHPPSLRLWRAKRSESGFDLQEEALKDPKYAFIGVRACELSAIEIQNKVFLGGSYTDPHYRARRQGAFIVAVNCTQAGGNCFCASMGTGPKVETGFDLALTEVLAPSRHYFTVEVGSEQGAELLKEIPHQEASQQEIATAQQLVATAAGQMGRELDNSGLKEILYASYDHPRWDEIAERCLSCGNCTMVCPTCFCTTVEDVTDLSGQEAERLRHWDSCFSIDFSYIHGGSVRASGKARYRQWLTHKLASWIDQFGSSGCVGCGRCITWCPVGIDITAEATAIRNSQAVTGVKTKGTRHVQADH